MARTIGNPLSWGSQALGSVGAHLAHVGEAVTGTDAKQPLVRKISYDDLLQSLRLGLADFAHFRTDVAVMCVLYPVIGILLTWAAFNRDLLPLIFPMASGFALLGPAAAVGFYEMSRRREAGMSKGWADGLGVLSSPAFGAILLFGLGLFALFIAWLMLAEMIFALTLGPDTPVSVTAFLGEVFGTAAGQRLILFGMLAGFVLAAAVLAASVISFPLLIDRNCGLPVAVATSLRFSRLNPGPVAAWGLIVAVALLVGSVPFFLGLIIVMPILGHATWHLYRMAVEPEKAKAKSRKS